MKNNLKATVLLLKTIFKNLVLEFPIVLFIIVATYVLYLLVSFSYLIDNFYGLAFSSLSELYQGFYLIFFSMFQEQLIYLAIIIFCVSMYLYNKLYNFFKKYPLSNNNIMMLSVMIITVIIYLFLIPIIILLAIILSKDLIMALLLIFVLFVFYICFVGSYIAFLQILLKGMQGLIYKMFNKVYYWLLVLCSIIPYILFIKYKGMFLFIQDIPVYLFLLGHLVISILWIKYFKMIIKLPIKSSLVLFDVDRFKKIPSACLNVLLIIMRYKSDFIMNSILIILYILLSSTLFNLLEGASVAYINIPLLFIGLGILNNYLVWYQRIARKLYYESITIFITLGLLVIAIFQLLIGLNTHFYLTCFVSVIVIMKYPLSYDSEKLSSVNYIIILCVVAFLLQGLFYVFLL